MPKPIDPPTTTKATVASSMDVTGPQKVVGRVLALGSTVKKDRLGFVTQAVPSISLDHEGISQSRHRGHLRGADARTPYLKRGTPIRNQRQVSLVAPADLIEIARRLGLPGAIDPLTLGANVVVEGIDQFSWLPRGTKLFFPSGLILIVEDQNAPCSLAGEAVMLAAKAHGHDDGEVKRRFPAVAQGLRGLVASVENPGDVHIGDDVTARIPQQWIYAPKRGA